MRYIEKFNLPFTFEPPTSWWQWTLFALAGLLGAFIFRITISFDLNSFFERSASARNYAVTKRMHTSLDRKSGRRCFASHKLFLFAFRYNCFLLQPMPGVFL